MLIRVPEAPFNIAHIQKINDWHTGPACSGAPRVGLTYRPLLPVYPNIARPVRFPGGTRESLCDVLAGALAAMRRRGARDAPNAA
jgi:hypothetical protein